MPERIPFGDHREDVAALLAELRRSERAPLGPSLLGRVVTEDVRARVDVPAADNSQMDGFALRAADLVTAGDGGIELPLGPPIAAGDPPGTLAPGTARPIMTGAPIPAGADLVVPVEESAPGRFDLTGPLRDAVVRLEPPAGAGRAAGRFVRTAGSDTAAGDVVLREGEALTPARIAHLAACGVDAVRMLARVRTVVLSTGSEVTDPSRPLPAGGAYDANGPGLAAALTEAGAEVIAVDRVPDDPAALLRLLGQHAGAGAELIVTSGGISEGAYEVVRQVAEMETWAGAETGGQTGCGTGGRDGESSADRAPVPELRITKVAMQPGGPQGIGTLRVGERRLAWLAFPGNPVSALLSCELFARPGLGAAPRLRLPLAVSLEDAARAEPSPPALVQFRRARVLPSGRVRLVGGPSSHLIGGLARADALVVIPVGTSAVHDGDVLETILLP